MIIPWALSVVGVIGNMVLFLLLVGMLSIGAACLLCSTMVLFAYPGVDSGGDPRLRATWKNRFFIGLELCAPMTEYLFGLLEMPPQLL